MIEQALRDRGLTLPEAPRPVASYAPFVVWNGLVQISGQLPLRDGAVVFSGLLGRDLDVAAGAEAAELCAINLLAQLKAACGGDLSRAARCIRLGGFVAAMPDFTAHPQVVNGASDLIAAVMGEAGSHARAAVGVSSLPLGAAVEVEATFALS